MHKCGGSWTEREVRKCQDPKECSELSGRKSRLTKEAQEEGIRRAKQQEEGNKKMVTQ